MSRSWRLVGSRVPEFACSSYKPRKVNVSIRYTGVTWGSGNGLSAGEETAGLGHLVAIFPISADAEGDSSDTNDKGAHDRSVGPPVSWLGVPTTRGGPNFLGVPARSNPLAPGGVMKITGTYGIFPPPPIVTNMQLKGLLGK